jgi:colanic acid/amylovoran biosynthesis glycosyltransferase
MQSQLKNGNQGSAVADVNRAKTLAFSRPAKPIDVLHAVPEVWLELTQTWLYGQIVSLPSHIRNHVLCQSTANLEQFPFPRIHSFEEQSGLMKLWDKGLRKLRLRRHLGHAVRTAKRLRPQVIHSHFGPTGWEMLDVAREVGAKHVVTFYGLDVNFLPKQGWLKPYQELFDRIDLVLCEGPHMARCVAELGCDAKKIRVHHLGVAVDTIAFEPRQWSPSQRLRVLMAASFREKKGLPYAIEALGLLSKSVDLEATIIGGASDSIDSRAEERRILDAIERGGLRDRITMLGYQPAARLMSEAREHHVFLSPSVTASNGDTEGGAPVSIIEMAASGMPIVSTTHCDIPEVVVDGETGFLAPERDAQSVATRFQDMLGQHPNWPGMLRRGRDRIEQQFSAAVQGEALAERYLSLIPR